MKQRKLNQDKILIRLRIAILASLLLIPIHGHSFSNEYTHIFSGLSEDLLVGVESRRNLSRGVLFESRSVIGSVSGLESSLIKKKTNRFSALPFSYYLGVGAHIDSRFESYRPGLMFKCGIGMSLSGYKDNINYDAVIRTSGDRDRPLDNQYITHRLVLTIANKFSWNSYFTLGLNVSAEKGGVSGISIGLKI